MSANIAFFGTSDDSIPILDALKDNDAKYPLVLCVTKRDTKVGRNHEIRETGVKKWSNKNGVDTVTIENLNSKTLALITDKLTKHNIGIAVIADFSFIIPSELVSSLEYGMINVHFSLLPKYRGASPVQQVIINDDIETGVTFQLVDEEVDSGDILYQAPYKMVNKETTEMLKKNLYELASKNISNVIDSYINKKNIPKKQDHSKASYCYSPTHPKSTLVYKDDALINWNEPADQIERKIRAYNPWPIAWTKLSQLENNSKLHKQIKLKSDNHLRKTVRIYEASVIKSNESSILMIEKLQIEGKNVMSWKDFVNGYCT